MSIRRIAILLKKEALYGSKSFFFVFAIVTPIALTLALSLVFGTLFSETPKLGIFDEGRSQVGTKATESDSVMTEIYDSGPRLEQAVERGAVDMGIVLAPGLDEGLVQGETVQVSAYVWGESLAKNRAIIGAALASIFRDIAGDEAPVQIITNIVGDAQAVPWEDRMLPLIVLMAVVIGGAIVPASSLVDEKQHRTIIALTMTPTSLGDVFMAKGLVGVVLGFGMGVLILFLNQVFSANPALLLFVLALGAIASAAFGIILGSLAKDITTLFTIIKALGLILYAPAFVYLFPGIPEWIGQIFPTYYIIGPVVEITQNGGGWPDIAVDVAILSAIIIALIGVNMFLVRKIRQQEVLITA